MEALGWRRRHPAATRRRFKAYQARSHQCDAADTLQGHAKPRRSSRTQLMDLLPIVRNAIYIPARPGTLS
jgi:hypothetical protein